MAVGRDSKRGVDVVILTAISLEPGSEQLPENPPPSALLNARYEVVPFHEQGREAILADLDLWCDEGPPVAVRLLHAEGGVGKTRLALEWSRRRSGRGGVKHYERLVGAPLSVRR